MTEYSMAEANNNLAKIMREVENGEPVKLLRRGKPVAVTVSLQEYERLTQPKLDFWSAYLRWREQVDWSEITTDQIDEVFGGVRDKLT
ncbi:MAG: type II toxin-antitoxin system Phd/YefM family antitoxin [Thermoflexales bacterium]|nr:type II toxin-antitoxin system Phd/YefM family antitoxin [Thermoflexales bacterium]MDW8352234.1 type II toxin-antitoxin system Phd/YefM family antitoxin [Anaerolineae bacterium]